MICREENNYNRINLPEAITYTNGTATYLYGTDGIKRRTSITEGGRTTTTDYCGNIIYKNDSLYLILIDEGYITMNNNSPQYHYFIKDHLGSNRVVISSTGNIEQQNAYYPFGGQMAPAQQSNLQPFKYNGKEQQTLQWLYTMDYGARWYNPSLARWTTPDPMSEKYYGVSPYSYCDDNPMNRIDPDGRDWKEKKDEEIAKQLQQQIAIREESLAQEEQIINLQIAKIKNNTKLSTKKKNRKIASQQDNIIYPKIRTILQGEK